MPASPKPSSSPAPGAALPSSRNPHYDQSDDHAPDQGLSADEKTELAALRAEMAEIRTHLTQKDAEIRRQAEQYAEGAPVGPSGLPAGMYPERDEYPEPRVFPRGTDVTEVIEHDRLEAEKRALARMSQGLPPVEPPLPKGAVTVSSADEFFAPRTP